MEVGPLAQCLTSYVGGNKEIKETVDMVLKKLDVKPDALFSTLGRIGARGIKCLVNAKRAEKWVDDLIENIKKGDTKTFTSYKLDESTNGQGMGLNDVARGSLGHWVNIEKGKIKNYQQVVPSTWNLGPADAKGRRDPWRTLSSELRLPIRRSLLRSSAQSIPSIRASPARCT